MELKNKDWERLKALRNHFLNNATDNYWESEHDLELYDAIYAERIGWKWKQALASLDRLRWKPQSDKIIDWGCGTGIASRYVTKWSGIDEIGLIDQSPLAMKFAQQKLLLQKKVATSWPIEKPFSEKTLLLISHVLSELQENEIASLIEKAATAHEIIWVEPGSHELSKKLGGIREILLKQGFHLLAPCTHEGACQMLQEQHNRDWCHFFAKPPLEIFQSAFWHEASHQLGIDLRSLPYSYLVFSRESQISFPQNNERLIGYPREFKGYGKLFCCSSSHLCERILQKRDNPSLFKKFIKNKKEGTFIWKLDDKERIIDGQDSDVTC